MTIYGNREPNGCGGLLVLVVLLGFSATVAYACWELGCWIVNLVIA